MLEELVTYAKVEIRRLCRAGSHVYPPKTNTGKCKRETDRQREREREMQPSVTSALT